MKTWWDYWPGLLILALLPFLMGVLPTISVKGEYIGGGVIRQWGINSVAEYLPLAAGQQYIDAFVAASYGQECLLFLPLALSFSALLFGGCVLFYSRLIALGNWMKRKEYDDQASASK
ncbi:MAG: hypothetical protein GY814_13975 [Gammaproteobacteria bacterium]|nr:hypothetical protein [Gammaproteobacteria bacterium]